MNEHELASEIDREVSDRRGQIALWICLGVVAGVVLIGSVMLFKQFT